VSSPPPPPPFPARTFTASVIREALKRRHLLWMLAAWGLFLPVLLVTPFQSGPFMTSQKGQVFLTSAVLVWGAAVTVFVEAAIVRGLAARPEGEESAERPRFPWAGLATLSAILGLIDAVLLAVIPVQSGNPGPDSGGQFVAFAIATLRVVMQVLFVFAPALVVAGARAETALLDSLRLVSKQFWWVFVVWMLLLLVSIVPMLPVAFYQVSIAVERGPDAPPLQPSLVLQMVALIQPAISTVLLGIAIARAVPLLQRD
jgi:hypothetical protein